MKKNILITLILFLGLTVRTTIAQSITPITKPTIIFHEDLTKEEIRKKVISGTQNLRKDIESQISEETKKKLQILRDNINSIIARITNEAVSAINGTTLTVTKDGKIYTVNTDSNTKFRRHFWGNSSLSEISVNDLVNVWGKFTDDAKTIIQATLVRDLSIQKRNGVFFGTVNSQGAGTFIMQTINRGNQTVTIGSAKLVDRKGQVITQINNGDKVRVRGMWDKTANTITEVTEIKDFSH